MLAKAVTVTGKGGTEVLRLQDIRLPWPRGERDVLVELRAAALNPADIFFRRHGGYILGSPMVLGHDGAGVVSAVGPGCTRVKPGDRVCFCDGGIGGLGTYAEVAVVDEGLLVPIPDRVAFRQAAAVGLVAITALESFADRARVSVGEDVLVHAGAGGTGHIALQIARLMGARVATTVGSREKARFVSELGAERAILYRETDFVAACLDWTGGKGVEVAYDNVGGETQRRTYHAMRPYGRVVTLMGVEPDLEGTAYNANLSILNEMMLLPMWRGLKSHAAHQAHLLGEAVRMLDDGQLNVHIAADFPLAQVARAHALLETGQVTGKIVLEIQAG